MEKTAAAPPAAAHPRPLDAALGVLLLVASFFFWEWGILPTLGDGIATTLFFIALLLGCLFYLRLRKIRQNRQSLLWLLAALAGSLPFALYGYRDINFCLILFEACLCLVWLASSCHTVLSGQLDSLLAGDLLNQTVLVPLLNLGPLVTWLTGRARRSDVRQQSPTNVRRIAAALLGLLASTPVLALVLVLLAGSDAGFSRLLSNWLRGIDLSTALRWGFNLFLALPLAWYLFAAIFGNTFRFNTAQITGAGLRRGFARAHALPPAALLAPLALLVAVYLLYFICMSGYLFAALGGELPQGYSFAQYARQGFFELCAVAVINLVVVGLTWAFARRPAERHPLSLRLLAGAMSLLTCLLIVTAASKMLLYIGALGLTPLRVETLWLMALLLAIFLLLTLWHLHPGNAARPVVICVVVFTLALGLTNTSALIASYNTERYLQNAVEEIDVALLESLAEPALPALRELREKADDPTVRAQATRAIGDIQAQWLKDEPRGSEAPWRDLRPWYRWNLQMAGNTT
ncbi:MAG: DUF4173 domain-containing protein [Coriobacteriales bacterium]|jgi:hypothetical protein|nr:DUF4173 domain-containing protein [Coriobacteriales bacterium]